MTFVLQITGTVAVLLLAFVGIPWVVRKARRRRLLSELDARWCNVDDSGLDDPETRAYFRVLYGMDPETALAAETSHPHRPMPGMDPEEVAR